MSDRPAHPGDTNLDLGRQSRIAMPEAIYAETKTVEQCVRIVTEMLQETDDPVIATRVTPEQQDALASLEPDGHWGTTLTWRHRPARPDARVAVVAGGTSDLPVVTEAQGVLSALGVTVSTHLDVGVTGLHRLLDTVPALADTDVVIAVAGMEAALPTVLAGLVPCPIIAVPTSVGYGAGLEGVTALLSMLASCAPGIAVVGIDNGFGAASAAHRILRP